MMRQLRYSLALACLAAARLFAEPVEFTRQQASDLFVALCKIEPGLSAENVVIAADNINALKPVVEALDRGKVRAQRDMDLLPPSDDRAAKAWLIRDKIDAKGDDKVTVDLTRMDVTSDEIKTAKIKPEYLAPLRQFLRPKSKP